MNIFLRKIPADTKYTDIYSFIEPLLKGGLFRRAGRIIKVEILALQDTRLNVLEFHGLVTVEPDEVGFRVIKQLKGCRFKGKLIMVRQHCHRSWQNDPRQNYRASQAGILEKRISDRRRGKDLEKIKDISERFSSEGDFVRKG